MTRHAANIKLLKILAEIINNNPELRFSQILNNYYFVKDERATRDHRISWQNEFYMESDKLLERVNKRLTDFEEEQE